MVGVGEERLAVAGEERLTVAGEESLAVVGEERLVVVGRLAVVEVVAVLPLQEVVGPLEQAEVPAAVVQLVGAVE